MSKNQTLSKSCICTFDESTGYFDKSDFKNFKADIVVGVSGTRNLDLAAIQRPEKLILFDFNNNLISFWKIFQESITKANNREEFLSYLKQKIVDGGHYCMNIGAYKELVENDSDSLTKNADAIIEDIKQTKWFKKDHFPFIKSLFEKTLTADEGVEFMQVDLTKKEGIEKLQKTICAVTGSKRLMFNFSNVLDFILGRDHREFVEKDGQYISQPRSEGSVRSEGYKEGILKQKKLIDQLVDGISPRFNKVLFLDSAQSMSFESEKEIRRIDKSNGMEKDEELRNHFHTYVLTPKEFSDQRCLKDKTIGRIKYKKAGINPTSAITLEYAHNRSTEI